MKKIVILGATSAIAQAVERLMAADGAELLLVGRSAERLQALQADLLARGAAVVFIHAADLGECSQHARILERARADLGGFDTVLLAYGTLLEQAACQADPALAAREIHVNFTSAAGLLTLFGEDLRLRGGGTLAVVTSVAGDRGRRPNYVYGAAKGGLSLFAQGLRSRLHPFGVRVLTIKPGLVDTPMTAHLPRSPLMAAPATVGRDIYRALRRSSPEVLYTPWYWKWIMLAVRAVPERWFKKLSF